MCVCVCHLAIRQLLAPTATAPPPPACRPQTGARTPDLHTAWSRTLLYLHASQARTLCSQMIICLRRLLPSLGSPCPLPRAGTGDGETRSDSALRTSVPIALRNGPRRVHVFLLARPQSSSRLPGEPPPQSPSARHILDGLLLQSTAARLLLLLFIPRARRQLLDLVASVVKLTCRLHQILVLRLVGPFR